MQWAIFQFHVQSLPKGQCFPATNGFRATFKLVGLCICNIARVLDAIAWRFIRIRLWEYSRSLTWGGPRYGEMLNQCNPFCTCKWCGGSVGSRSAQSFRYFCQSQSHEGWEDSAKADQEARDPSSWNKMGGKSMFTENSNQHSYLKHVENSSPQHAHQTVYQMSVQGRF